MIAKKFNLSKNFKKKKNTIWNKILINKYSWK